MAEKQPKSRPLELAIGAREQAQNAKKKVDSAFSGPSENSVGIRFLIRVHLPIFLDRRSLRSSSSSRCRFGRDSLRGEELSNEGCLDLGCLGHPVASFLEQRGDPGAGCPFEDAAENVPQPCQLNEKVHSLIKNHII